MATPQNPTRKPLLDLDSFAETPQIRVDGELYDLRLPDHITIVEGVRIRKVSPRLDELQAKEAAGTLNEDEAVELTQILDMVARIVLKAPDSVHERLADWQRIAIVLSFSGLSTPRLQATRAATEPASSSSPTGASSSPSSRASTRRSSRKRG
jgi:hypothetical protein